MPSVYYSMAPEMLQANVWQGPATITQVDVVDGETNLRPNDTLSWKKTYAEYPYDFPNSYVTLPLRWLNYDPRSTYADDQNNRFVQRYVKK
jgi:hypothetical protein